MGDFVFHFEDKFADGVDMMTSGQFMEYLTFGRTRNTELFTDIYNLYAYADGHALINYPWYVAALSFYEVDRDKSVENGIEALLDAYFDGVPVDDIVC